MAMGGSPDGSTSVQLPWGGGKEESEGRRKGGKGGDMRGRVREEGEKREKKGKGGEERKEGRREGEGEREKWEMVKNWVIMNEGK